MSFYNAHNLCPVFRHGHDAGCGDAGKSKHLLNASKGGSFGGRPEKFT